MIINDQSYIERILKGDTHAFGILVDRYKTLVYTLCLRMMGNREEAEEVSQDTFLKVYRSMGRFKGDSKFSTWIYRIAYNTCLDRIKKNKHRHLLSSIDEKDHFDIGFIESRYDDLDKKARAEAIKSCLEKLPGDTGFILTLYYYEELSLKEIADITGNGLNNIKVKLFRSRKKLMHLLKENLEPELLEGYENRIRPSVR
ncbi:MAG: sigma-70 family RNA polymerase sigma factor [Flavobacteriaceae bacterium]|nr:sigma-70 family RNA polymerase sigma factor [Flavobacteriaceae bacterium]